MLASSRLLRSYVRAIHRLSGARGVSLYVPGSSTGLWQPILLHAGDGAPAPELADSETAARFHHSRDTGENELTSQSDVASASRACRLIRIPTIQTLVAAGAPEDAQQRRRLDRAAAADLTTSAWIGLRFTDADDTDPKSVDGAPDPAEWWSWLLALGGALALHVQVVSDLLDDPVTGLPDRAEFQAHLSQSLHVAKASHTPLSLLLLNPEDFVSVNESFGREVGDVVLRAVAEELRAVLRDVDLVAKYGGAVFAVVLHGTPVAEAKGVACKVRERLSAVTYSENELKLRFSIGVAAFDPASDRDDQPLDLMRMADQSLRSAKRSGGGEIVVWEPGSTGEESDGLDRLSGIFTASMAKDYRNMVLLWDTVTVVAKNSDFETLSAQVAERLFTTFKPEEVALFRWTDENELLLVHGLKRDPEQPGAVPVGAVVLTSEQRVIMDEARSQARPLQATLDEAVEEPGVPKRSFYAVPLIVDEHCLGSLYLTGREGDLALDKSDLIFLRALGGQLALALDRARLAAQERRRLEGELRQLRSALRHSKLVFRSQQMETLLALVRRVAPTDATVLISGESGTGKELMAATIHELSKRRKSRLEIVDCATIAPTLIESELFGHEAGAYTGAGKQKLGRLVLADGGTVVLDEIGELPLEIQGRLLRFVQEKQVTPVGGTRSRQVDVRVIAATNRDLADEVAKGRFREDLYYRLNVIRVGLPPLRDRPDDIVFLANHFLKTFAVQYQRPAQAFTAAAESQLLAHRWPGNVRELSNRLMQATILCEREELDTVDLGLTSELAELPEPPPPQTLELSAITMREATESAAPSERDPESVEDAWHDLERTLRDHVMAAARRGDRPALGRHLDEDLVHAAYRRSERVSARAAKVLGIPETTFRRKLSKLSRRATQEGTSRPDRWDDVTRALDRIVAGDSGGDNVLERARKLLLHEVITRLPDNDPDGAALMSVSIPTYRRQLARQLVEAVT